jgi:hypothetical protein
VNVPWAASKPFWERIAKLTPDLLVGGLTPEQIAQRIEQTKQAIENRIKLETELESEAAALIAHGDLVLRSITMAHEMRRWIDARELARYLRTSLASLYPGCSVRDLDCEDTYEIRLTPEARVAYVDWLQSRRLPTVGGSSAKPEPWSVASGAPPPGED